MSSLERGRLGEKRRELLADLSGEVLDVGAGTGANLAHLPNTVRRVIAVESDPAMTRRLQRRAVDHPADIEVVGAAAEALPLPDHCVDVVVTTLVLCTVQDPQAAVSELRRVLRPGGQLVVIEHVVDPAPRRARRQERLTPAWRVVARGCHLDRDTLTTLARGGFDVSGVGSWELSRHGPTVPAISGIARPR
ncbi:MAG: class I SAM-dependent methyltransferase [Nitriliruptor sp.]|nr:MAG: class I SAM-dependent methyltransferase [Nitriliruptor sp.]